MLGIDPGPVDLQRITVPGRPNRRARPTSKIGLQRLPQATHMHLERRGRCHRRRIPPQALDQRVPLDRARRVHQQGSQQPLHDSPAKPNRRPRTQHARLAEHFELHLTDPLGRAHAEFRPAVNGFSWA
jgi:hypothetical protein